MTDLKPSPHVLLQLLRAAIDEDSFVVCSEPIVDLASGEPCMYELTLRLSSDDERLVAASSVDSIAERFALTTQLDDMLIRHTVGLAADGQAIAVRVHSASLADPDLAGRTAQAVVEGRGDPAAITFELAEPSLTTNATAASAFAVRAHEVGCRVTIDRFGTGSAGFGFLERLPVDCLKIDPGFIIDLRMTPSDEQFVQAFAQLADGLGISSAADGVRDAKSLEILVDAGVGLGQGPYFGPPVPVPPGGLAKLAALHRAAGAS